MKRVSSAVILLAAGAMCFGCGTESGTATPAGSTTKSVSQPTAAKFDPCTDIDDATAQKMGFEPATKTTSTLSQGDNPTLPGCEFSSPQTGVRKVRAKITTIVRNDFTTLEEQHSRFASTIQPPLTVNGRDSFMTVNDIDSTGSCLLLFRLGKGVLFVAQHIDTRAEAEGMKACDGLPDLAKTLEPVLPKGN